MYLFDLRFASNLILSRTELARTTEVQVVFHKSSLTDLFDYFYFIASLVFIWNIFAFWYVISRPAFDKLAAQCVIETVKNTQKLHHRVRKRAKQSLNTFQTPKAFISWAGYCSVDSLFNPIFCITGFEKNGKFTENMSKVLKRSWNAH